MKRRVLILCSGNSARSQMAAGFWRQIGGQQWQVASAGTAPRGLHPLAVRVMAEVGIDISGQPSRGLDELCAQQFDLVVTVCADAQGHCPHLPGARRREHWPLDDPAAATGSEHQRLGVFRQVRDEIGARVREYLGSQRT